MLIRAPHSINHNLSLPLVLLSTESQTIALIIPVELQRSKPKMFLLASSSGPSSLAASLVLSVDLYSLPSLPSDQSFPNSLLFCSLFYQSYWRGTKYRCSLNFMPDSILPMTCWEFELMLQTCELFSSRNEDTVGAPAFSISRLSFEMLVEPSLPCVTQAMWVPSS